MRLAPVSNRVGTGSDEELLFVEMQHVRYGVSMSVQLLRLTTCLLAKLVRLEPVSNRVGTGSNEELLLVEMQHVRSVAITVMQRDQLVLV